MVFQDLQGPELSHSKTDHARAPLHDRFNAFCFDLLLLSPIVSLITVVLVYPLSFLETWELAAVSAFVAVLTWTYISAAFLFVAGATPGKSLMKLRVVDFENGETPDLSQSLARSLLWIAEFLALALPLAALMKEENRRPIHDRWSGTIVVTYKEDEDAVVQPSEIQLGRTVQRFGVGLLALWILFVAVYIYPQFEDLKASQSLFSGKTKKSKCEQVQASLSSQFHVLDQVLVLNSLGLVNSDCVDEISEKMFDKDSQLDQAWGALARALIYIEDQETTRAYQKEVCVLDSSLSGPCVLAQKLLSEDSVESETLLGSHLNSKRGFETEARISEEKSSGVLSLAKAIDKLQAGVIAGTEDQTQNFNRLKAIYPMGNFNQEEGKMCLASITRSCQDIEIESCRAMTERLELKIAFEDWSTEETLGWIEYQKCRKQSKGTLAQWRAIYEDRQDIYQLARGLIGGEDGQTDLAALEQVTSNSSLSDFIRSRALVHLVHDARVRDPNKMIELSEKMSALKLDSFSEKIVQSSLKSDLEKLGLQVIESDDRMPASSETIPMLKPRWRKQ